MPGPQAGSILVVGGTHGNEPNAPWLLQQWQRQPDGLQHHGFALQLVLGNPAALAVGRRYIERDLNRSFAEALLADSQQQSLEVQRARALLQAHGSQGASPALVVLDLHSTTAAMGNSLVVYGRRPADLALAAGIQQRLGLPVSLHEADQAQQGFLVERWPCGLVIEVGPVPQGLLHAGIARQSQLALEAALAVLDQAAAGSLRLPAALVVHRHLGSVDLPRHGDGTPSALLHPRLLGRDWAPVRPADPVFLSQDGHSIVLEAVLPARLQGESCLWPVFINEAAYGEKGIAFSLTRRETWPLADQALSALGAVALGLTRRRAN
jgi:aspartoacylase